MTYSIRKEGNQMLLFNRKNKDESKAMPKQREINGHNNPSSFYTECVADYHKAAKSLGYANKDVILIPELIPYGQRTVLAFLKDDFFRMEFSNNPTQYYYVIMILSLQSGIAFAQKWHLDFKDLINGYVDKIIAVGPANAAEEILIKNIGLDKKQADRFYTKIFERWIALHEPYWELSDPREYTFYAMLAAYQLGISMILETHGF